jgi:hypothetical protein
VRLNRKGIPKDLGPKTLRLKRGDIRVRTRGDLTAVVWRDKRDVCLLTNIHDPPTEGNTGTRKSRRLWQIITVTWGMLTMQIGWPIATRPAVEHGSGQKSSFSTCWTWPLSTVTSFYLHVVGRKSHTYFRFTLIREMLARAGHEPRPSMPVGRPAQSSTNIGRLDTSHNKHWPGRSQTKRRCRVCSVGGVKPSVIYKCVKCDVGLCVDRECFKNYHTKPNL